eukprot:CAMPEP_0194274130 /NCGR_PEP_ID=MMETSP0169-20130528/7294_1 /TAXON_ID=218684 /ORGANISM="Corethron pennatum, Strain L29A3" /LENGTH=405 /DNA_ID=CAMNT_0039017247 /DNA_START=20 /DNA_END=1237 /DNA_ORIENTATION=-
MQANKNKVPRVPQQIPKWEDEEIIPKKSSSQKTSTFDNHTVVLYEVEVRGLPFSGARRKWHRSTEEDDNSACPHWVRAHNRKYFFAKDNNDTVEDVYPTVPPIYSEGKKAHTWEWKSGSTWTIDKTRSRQIQIGELYVPGYRTPSAEGYSAVDEKGWEYSTDLARFDDRRRPMRGVQRLTDRVRRRRWVRRVEIEGHRNVKVQEKAFSVQEGKISRKAEGNQGKSSLPVSIPSQAAQLPLEEKESSNEVRRNFQGSDGDDSCPSSSNPEKESKSESASANEQVADIPTQAELSSLCRHRVASDSNDIKPAPHKEPSPRHNSTKSHTKTQAERMSDSLKDNMKTLKSSKATMDKQIFKKVDKGFWNKNKAVDVAATIKSHDDSIWDEADSVITELNKKKHINSKKK